MVQIRCIWGYAIFALTFLLLVCCENIHTVSNDASLGEFTDFPFKFLSNPTIPVIISRDYLNLELDKLTSKLSSKKESKGDVAKHALSFVNSLEIMVSASLGSKAIAFLS